MENCAMVVLVTQMILPVYPSLTNLSNSLSPEPGVNTQSKSKNDEISHREQTLSLNMNIFMIA